MGLFDKLKGAMNAVTGGAAKVTIELAADRGISFVTIFPNELTQVSITATSTGAELKSKGVFVDVQAVEQAVFQDPKTKEEATRSETVVTSTFQIAGDFTLGPNETKVFQGSFVVPAALPPTYEGRVVKILCHVRGRIEAFGNDPDSGFIPVRVGLR